MTIVITSYNQEAFLRDAILSAVHQTVQSRVLVVDDGSSDGSVTLARSLGVDVLALPHQGVVSAYRSGVAAISTPYFVILNGDDMLAMNFVERTLPRMEAGVGFVYTGYEYFGSKEGVVRPRPFSLGRFLWNNEATITSLTSLHAYRDAGGFSDTFSEALEDWALWIAILARGWTCRVDDEPLLSYRIHSVGSRNSYDPSFGLRTRITLMRRHPSLYVAGSPGLFVEAARGLLRRLLPRRGTNTR